MNHATTLQPATKQDISSLQKSLKNFATKDDLKQFATKKDLKKFSTKTELKQVEKNLRGEILQVEERIENIEGKVGNIEDGQSRLEKKIDGVESRLEAKIDTVEERLSLKIDRVITTLDGFVKVVDDLRIDNEVGVHHTRELEITVKDHGKRLTKLESTAHST